MLRSTLIVLALALPALAGAQAFKCVQNGTTLYTDQPCKGGETVVPERTPEELQAERDRADVARARMLEQSLDREQARLDARQQSLAATGTPPAPWDSADCRAARQEAAFRANTFSATPEQIRTARANAALACGQPAPEEQIVVLPHVRRGWGDYSYGSGWQRPRQPPRRSRFNSTWGDSAPPDVNYQPPIPLR